MSNISYKKSKIEWLENIPKHWITISAKRVFHIVNGSTPSSSNSEYWDGEIRWITPADFQFIEKGEIFNTQRQITEEGLNSCGTSIIPIDSLIITTRAPIGKVCINKIEMSTNQGCRSLVPISNDISIKYYYYFFLTQTSKLQSLGLGTTFMELSKTDLGYFCVPKPTLSEQKQISNFLDTKISQLDSLISKKQELIKKLKEKRIALITQAVTKGLDDSVPTKNSGIQWLGDIPQHWEVRRLRFLIKSNPVKSEVSNLDDDIEVSFLPMEAINEYGGISYENIKAIGEVYNGYTFFRNRDVLVAKITPCFENGKGTIANNLINEIGFGTTELHVMRANEEIDIEYLFYLSISDSFRKLGNAEMLGAGGQKRVPEEFIKNFKIGFPAIEEQEQIVSYLNKHLSKLDNLISLNEKSITKLEEYRIALITNAVTGKIDLSNWQTDSETNSKN